MRLTRVPCRQPSSRNPFRTPCQDDQHTEFLCIDATLPTDHHARRLRSVVDRLDLKPLRLSYTNLDRIYYYNIWYLSIEIIIYIDFLAYW